MNAPLKIGVVSETWAPEVNGVAMTMSRLTHGLRERGHSIHVVRPRQKNETAPGPDETLVSGLPLPGYNGLQFGLPAERALSRLWQENRPDVVHVVTEGPLGWSALRAARRAGIPVTSSYHTHFDGYTRHYGARLVGPLIAAWLRRFHRRTQATLAPTAVLAEKLRQTGVPDTRVLGRGVDTRLFSPERRSEALRTEWGVEPDELVVLNVGRLAPEKNLRLAALAFEAIEAENLGARMVWVGDGPSRAALERNHPRHLFTGTQQGEALAACYASADLFLFPSLTETYGNVVAEAMASGLAVLAYHDAAAAELIVSGENGLTVTPGAAESFVTAALRLARDKQLRERCREAARPRVEPLGWEAVISDFEALLHATATRSAN